MAVLPSLCPLPTPLPELPRITSQTDSWTSHPAPESAPGEPGQGFPLCYKFRAGLSDYLLHLRQPGASAASWYSQGTGRMGAWDYSCHSAWVRGPDWGQHCSAGLALSVLYTNRTSLKKRFTALFIIRNKTNTISAGLRFPKLGCAHTGWGPCQARP